MGTHIQGLSVGCRGRVRRGIVVLRRGLPQAAKAEACEPRGLLTRLLQVCKKAASLLRALGWAGSLPLHGLHHPVHALPDAVAGVGAARLDVPDAPAQCMQLEAVGDLRHRHRVWEVLLVRKDEEWALLQQLLTEHLIELDVRVLYAVAVIAVDDEDDSINVLVEVAVQRTNLRTATNVPAREARDVRPADVFHTLHMEADGGDCGFHLPSPHLVEDGGLSSSIQANH
mmetsp:Transcript_45910/g.118778  ORF Transcript_45910/g.118778 Transcript_45910/m.118778 type:complete len:228 (-) Transcript_45910:141-824(-)